MENKPTSKGQKPSIRDRIANIIVIVQPKPSAATPPPSPPKKKSNFDLLALILKILGTLIALFKLFK